MSNPQLPANNNGNNHGLSLPFATDLFKDVDFQGLNAAVDALAQHNGTLSDEEKKSATTILTDWENDVLTRIHQKQHDMLEFIRFFDTDIEEYRINHDRAEEMGAAIADQTNTILEFEDYQKAIQALRAKQQERPLEPIIGLDTTFNDKLELNNAYELELKKHEIETTKLRRIVLKAYVTWIRLVKEDEKIRELLKKANAFSRNVQTYQNDCRNKTQLAKLNVTISSKDTRDSLRQLLDFAKTI